MFAQLRVRQCPRLFAAVVTDKGRHRFLVAPIISGRENSVKKISCCAVFSGIGKDTAINVRPEGLVGWLRTAAAFPGVKRY